MNHLTSAIRCELMSVFLDRLFTNLTRDFLTNIDWLLQSRGSIDRLEWFIKHADATIYLFISNLFIVDLTTVGS